MRHNLRGRGRAEPRSLDLQVLGRASNNNSNNYDNNNHNSNSSSNSISNSNSNSNKVLGRALPADQGVGGAYYQYH